MKIRRRRLRKLLIAIGCVVADVGFPGAMIGGLLLLVGSSLHLWSKGCLEQNRRLTTTGPYRWTRNPFYLANLLIELGLCFVIGRGWLAVVFVPVWWFAYRETILREEARLLSLFPDQYPEYLTSVPRLIPSGRRLRRDRAEGIFSWNNDALARGSEYARLLGVWLAPGLIWASEFLRHQRMAIFEAENSWALGIMALLCCAWVIKLALAETFRRPKTALLPVALRPILRHGVTVSLLLGALLFRSLWAASLPGLWCILMALDRLGNTGLDPNDSTSSRAWPYFPAIAIGSVGTYVGIAVMVRIASV